MRAVSTVSIPPWKNEIVMANTNKQIYVHEICQMQNPKNSKHMQLKPTYHRSVLLQLMQAHIGVV